jgi:uncharacterized protein YegP (UPF0339 family)
MATSNKGSYHLFKNDKITQKYHWVLKASNGEIILKSENYFNRDDALNGIHSCQTNSPDDENYDRLIAKDKSPYFNLKAQNNKIIGTSEMYSSPQKRDEGIESVKKHGPTKSIVDETGTANSTGETVTSSRPERSNEGRYA